MHKPGCTATTEQGQGVSGPPARLREASCKRWGWGVYAVFADAPQHCPHVYKAERVTRETELFTALVVITSRDLEPSIDFCLVTVPLS